MNHKSKHLLSITSIGPQCHNPKELRACGLTEVREGMSDNSPPSCLQTGLNIITVFLNLIEVKL